MRRASKSHHSDITSESGGQQKYAWNSTIPKGRLSPWSPCFQGQELIEGHQIGFQTCGGICSAGGCQSPWKVVINLVSNAVKFTGKRQHHHFFCTLWPCPARGVVADISTGPRKWEWPRREKRVGRSRGSNRQSSINWCWGSGLGLYITIPPPDGRRYHGESTKWHGFHVVTIQWKWCLYRLKWSPNIPEAWIRATVSKLMFLWVKTTI